MQKIIKFGFCPIVNDLVRGQNDIKGQKLFKSGHVLSVVETEEENNPPLITGTVVAQTSISNVYSVKIILDENRHINHATCTCKAGLSGKCKHVCAVIHYVNSPESAYSKTSQSQSWGKPSHRQLLGYDKGARMSSLFPPPLCSKVSAKVAPLKVSTETVGDSLAGTPLCVMSKFEEKNKVEIMAAESLVEIIQVTEKRNVEEKAKKVALEIFMLQYANKLFSQEVAIAKELYDFYLSNVCCSIDGALSICVNTLNQSENAKWFEERKLRITASNAYKMKGTRFDRDKVISNLLNPGQTETSAMSYGKKNESIALQEYEKLLNPGSEVIKVGLIVNINQPWLSCSPDGVLVFGPNIWERRLVEIKCPYCCKNLPIYDEDSHKINVKYIKLDENGFQLSHNHSIYVQVQLQMYVTNIAYCDLFIYSPKGSLLITIKRNDELLSKLVPHLENFYFNHYLQRLYESNRNQFRY